MVVAGEKNMINVGVVNAENGISVSKDIAPVVKLAAVNGTVVPLFPTKNGYEYFVLRASRRA